MQDIGATLRDARMRARIDVSEVETQTKIRAKYLRALENEEWDLLPGPTFVKTFLRTYAEYLDRDPRLLVEEYRQRFEWPSSQELTPFRRPSRRPRRRVGALVGPGVVLFGGLVVLLAVFYVLGTWGDDDDGAMSVDEAADRLRKSGLAGMIYTSPSHTEERPRWRVMCPTLAAIYGP